MHAPSGSMVMPHFVKSIVTNKLDIPEVRPLIDNAVVPVVPSTCKTGRNMAESLAVRARAGPPSMRSADSNAALDITNFELVFRFIALANPLHCWLNFNLTIPEKIGLRSCLTSLVVSLRHLQALHGVSPVQTAVGRLRWTLP